MILLDGKQLSKEIELELSEKVQQLKSEGKKTPHLAAILVGSDPASQTYVGAKVKACERVGFDSTLIELPATTSEADLLKHIEKLNNDEAVNGFIVQLPLPPHIDENKVIKAVDPLKDVDGFHPENVGKMVLDLPAFISATPNGIVEILKRYKIETEGKHCVVIGRSHIVGSPMSILMAKNSYPGNCTVTLAHSRTKNLKEVCQSADILIVAIGKAEFVDETFIKEGAVVVDVGMHRIPDSSKKNGFRLTGDVNFEKVSPLCSAITPVPKGVGPMTISSLMMNTLKALSLQ